MKTLRVMPKKSARRGFTLIEVLIAIAIVVALGAIVGINLLGSRDQADKDTAMIQLNSIQDAMLQFQLVYRRFPTEDEGLSVLWDKEVLDVEDEALEEKWTKFLTKPAPKDLWGNEWQYRVPGEFGDPYDIWSAGPDREEDTEDDIKSWSAESEEGGGSAPLPTE